MTVPASVAAVSCLCPLVVFLCVISQSCCGTRVNVNPHANHNPSLYPNPRFKSSSETTLLPSTSPDKLMSLMKSSHLLSSSQTLPGKSDLKPRLEGAFYLRDDQGFNSDFPSTVPNTASNTRLKPQHASSKKIARNALTNPQQLAKVNSKTNPKPRPGSLSQPKPRAVLSSGNVPGVKSSSGSTPNNKLSLQSGFIQRSNSSGTQYPRTYYNTSLASLSNPRSHSKLRPSLEIDTNPKSNSSKTSIPNSRTSTRAQRNQTKLKDTDKDSYHVTKRGWIWNQFFVLEEHIGTEPQYVGKVRKSFSSYSIQRLYGLCLKNEKGQTMMDQEVKEKYKNSGHLTNK